METRVCNTYSFNCSISKLFSSKQFSLNRNKNELLCCESIYFIIKEKNGKPAILNLHLYFFVHFFVCFMFNAGKEILHLFPVQFYAVNRHRKRNCDLKLDRNRIPI